MSIIQAFILGILQGLTEFLPVSSSGHLTLFENIFGLESGGLFFNVILHFATLIAVVIIFWKDVVGIIKNPFGKESVNIIIASIPTFISALLVRIFIDEYLLSVFIGYGFLITSVILLLTILTTKKEKLLININKKQAFTIGVVQGLAVFPGISRSGSTICAGLMLGVKREECAKFSFLISLPVILGGTIFETIEGVKNGFGEVNAITCIIGFISAFIVALFTIKLMMRVVKNGNLWGFSIYMFLLSIFILLNQYVLCLF